MVSKKIKTIKGAITYILLGLVMLVSCATYASANSEKKFCHWNVDAYYGDETYVSEFIRKDTSSSIRLMIKSSNGPMDFKALGALSEQPGSAYSDCSSGRVVRAYACSDDVEYSLVNFVNEWNYRYAGVMGMAVTDSYTSAYGYFQADK